MKKLGLIGGTGPESTICYYKQITSLYQQQNGNFPNLVIESLNVFDVLRYVEGDERSKLVKYLLKGIASLEAAGAKVVALTGITPHLVIEQVKKFSSLPLISMLDTTLEYLKEKNYQNVLLLGTEQTLQAGFFQKYLSANDVDVVLPSTEEIHYIGQKIENELELGKVTTQTVRRFAKITNSLIENKKIDAVILGCTELPLAFDNISLSVPKVDVMKIHIQKLVEIIQ